MTGYLFGAECLALLVACYGAGRAALPLRWTAAVAAGAVCVPALELRGRPVGLTAVTGFAAAYLVFALLPLLAGRYMAAQRRLAEQERLRERLRIAREMHDSLGRRLSLAAVEAAALEVSDLPARQRAATGRLAAAIRASVVDLHKILAVLHDEREGPRGLSDVAGLIEEFRAAGAVVCADSDGPPHPLPAQADEAAYWVLDQGLTNAIRHAPGRPVSVTTRWESGLVHLTVVNAADHQGYAPGFGLAGLAGRVQQAGGLLRHELSRGQFRLCAALPFSPRAAARKPQARNGRGATVLGFAVGILLLVILPAAVLIGVH